MCYTCGLSDGYAALSQGITLVLSACCQLQHQPSEGLLEALAAAMARSLSAFKRQELASCLDAFKALAFHPGNDLIQVSLLRWSYACIAVHAHSACMFARALPLCTPVKALSLSKARVGNMKALCCEGC